MNIQTIIEQLDFIAQYNNTILEPVYLSQSGKLADGTSMENASLHIKPFHGESEEVEDFLLSLHDECINNPVAETTIAHALIQQGELITSLETQQGFYYSFRVSYTANTMDLINRKPICTKDGTPITHKFLTIMISDETLNITLVQAEV